MPYVPNKAYVVGVGLTKVRARLAPRPPAAH
jgi:hypothetical protein